MHVAITCLPPVVADHLHFYLHRHLQVADLETVVVVETVAVETVAVETVAVEAVAVETVEAVAGLVVAGPHSRNCHPSCRLYKRHMQAQGRRQ